MRYIILKTEVNIEDGSLDLLGLIELSQKSSGFTPRWINLKEAKTNCLNPKQCDLLSFEEKEEIEELLETTGLEDNETIVLVGVDV